MIHALDERLKDEIRRYRLAFACEHCAHFDERGAACSLGYPNEEHLARTLDGDRIVFCKAFELS